MRDPKTSLLLLLSLLLLSLSLVLLSIWGYNFYFTGKGKNNPVSKPASANEQKTNSIRDSLQKEYATTIVKLDNRIDSTENAADSAIGNVDNNLEEINKLKAEITTILKKNSSLIDLGTAREKINKLQQKIEQLRSRNLDVEKENKRLNALLVKLTSDKADIDKNGKRSNSASNPVNEKIVLSSAFFVSDLHLTGLMTTDEEKEKETNEADDTEKMAGSFVIQCNNNEITAADVIVVVLQPNGKVLQNSVWETGTFDTPEGKMAYSAKIHFDCSKGEAKRLPFSLISDKFERGNYVVQLYYGGAVISRAVKTLL
jgi:hypothetical protein